MIASMHGIYRLHTFNCYYDQHTACIVYLGLHFYYLYSSISYYCSKYLLQKACILYWGAPHTCLVVLWSLLILAHPEALALINLEEPWCVWPPTSTLSAVGPVMVAMWGSGTSLMAPLSLVMVILETPSSPGLAPLSKFVWTEYHPLLWNHWESMNVECPIATGLYKQQWSH